MDDGGVEIIKRGVNNVHMDFRPGKKHLASYQTPYGPLLLGMQTHAVQIDEREDRLDVRLEYDLGGGGRTAVRLLPDDGSDSAGGL